jgi:hypothetical protein
MIRLRDFIAGLGVAAWPFAAYAQQRSVPVIGVLYGGRLDAFRSGLGPVDIRNYAGFLSP